MVAVGLTLAAGLAVTGVTVARAQGDERPGPTEAQATADQRNDEVAPARRAAWRRDVTEYAEALALNEYALAAYANAAEQAAASSGLSSALASIRACESGGDYTAVSSSGTYRGAYQFDLATWQAVGGTGDPAAAPPAEQDRRAQMLYEQAGSSPWPVCG
jgi:peptidoglycan endopeptidase LytE